MPRPLPGRGSLVARRRPQPRPDRSAPLADSRHWRIVFVRSVVFLETPVFKRRIRELVDDEDYRRLQVLLLLNPEAGDLIAGSGGLRKIRMGVRGRGKRGGARVIYYWYDSRSQIYMLLVYAKNERDDLSGEQLIMLRTLVKQEFD